jgi:hypothetical protein
MTYDALRRQYTMDAVNLDNLYGSPLPDWDRIEERLARRMPQAPGTGGPNRHTCWLATINRDGSPHVTGIGALWGQRWVLVRDLRGNPGGCGEGCPLWSPPDRR